MKKILAILCTIAMLCSLSLFAFAAETETAVDVALPSGSGWVQTDTNTTLWGGTLDAGFLVPGGTLKIYLTANAADLWQVRLVLNGNGWIEMDWHVDPTSVANPIGTMVDNGDGTMVVSFAYEDIVAVYGTDDFVGTVGAISIITNAASDVTVTAVTYAVPAEDTPSGGEDVANGGDAISVVLAMMAASAAALVVLGKKKF